ncbi:PLDc N-terminal domain-containing protein [Thermodesulfobacteriota bacterium B35]
MESYYWIPTGMILIADLTIRIGLSIRVIMRKRAASVTLAWLVIILLLPFVGAFIYLLFGENRLGEHRAARAAADLRVITRWADSLRQRTRWTGSGSTLSASLCTARSTPSSASPPCRVTGLS